MSFVDVVYVKIGLFCRALIFIVGMLIRLILVFRFDRALFPCFAPYELLAMSLILKFFNMIHQQVVVLSSVADAFVE